MLVIAQHTVLDPAVKHVSRNEYFAVDAGHGLGLPAETLAAQPAV